MHYFLKHFHLVSEFYCNLEQNQALKYEKVLRSCVYTIPCVTLPSLSVSLFIYVCANGNLEINSYIYFPFFRILHISQILSQG